MRIQAAEIEYLCINLDHRDDRWVLSQGQFRRVGLSVRRFRAFTSADWIWPQSEIACIRQHNPGGAGCLMSHLALIDRAGKSGRLTGIFEDDVLLCQDFADRLRYVEECFDRPWDLFFLNSTYHCHPPFWHKETLGRDFEQTEIKHIHRVYGLFATQSYLVNPASAGRIRALMHARAHDAYAVDHLLLMLQPELQAFCFTPGMTFQRDGRSDHGGGYTKFSDFYRLCGPYVFTERLADFDYDAYDWAEGKFVAEAGETCKSI